MKEGIKRPRADLVAVAAKLLQKPKTEDCFLGGMMKNMKPDEPFVEVLIRRYHFHPFYIDLNQRQRQ